MGLPLLIVKKKNYHLYANVLNTLKNPFHWTRIFYEGKKIILGFPGVFHRILK